MHKQPGNLLWPKGIAVSHCYVPWPIIIVTSAEKSSWNASTGHLSSELLLPVPYPQLPTQKCTEILRTLESTLHLPMGLGKFSQTSFCCKRKNWTGWFPKSSWALGFEVTFLISPTFCLSLSVALQPNCQGPQTHCHLPASMPSLMLSPFCLEHLPGCSPSSAARATKPLFKFPPLCIPRHFVLLT